MVPAQQRTAKSGRPTTFTVPASALIALAASAEITVDIHGAQPGWRTPQDTANEAIAAPTWSRRAGAPAERLLASLVWHAKDDESYLEQLPEDHPLRVSPLYTEGWIEKLKPHVVTGLFKCEKSGMVASGLPPHCAIMLRLVKLEMKIDTLIGDGTDSLRAQLKEDLKASIEQFCEQQGNISQATLQAALASAMDGLRGQLMAALHPEGVPEEQVDRRPRTRRRSGTRGPTSPASWPGRTGCRRTTCCRRA